VHKAQYPQHPRQTDDGHKSGVHTRHEVRQPAYRYYREVEYVPGVAKVIPGPGAFCGDFDGKFGGENQQDKQVETFQRAAPGRVVLVIRLDADQDSGSNNDPKDEMVEPAAVGNLAEEGGVHVFCFFVGAKEQKEYFYAIFCLA
jgi:hypothetical protein